MIVSQHIPLEAEDRSEDDVDDEKRPDDRDGPEIHTGG